MKFGIMAPGVIANTMAKAVTGLIEADRCPGLEAYAVASRSYDRAKAFADKWGFEKAYGSYEEMVNDPAVELIYVCPPHTHHMELAKLCLEHGKNVLVEKPFTVNEAQAKILIDLAREKGLFIAEAIWTRYMPSRQMINDIIASGAIGKMTTLTANLGYEMSKKERLVKPELAGGALLDVGVYPINFALMVAESEVKHMTSSAVLSKEGVDLYGSFLLEFESGLYADLHTTMLANTDRRGMIYGEKGYLEIQNINNVEEIRRYDLNYQLVETYEIPAQINGFEYQVMACVKAIEAGRLECDEMPHSEILRVMRIMDSLRASWGLKYPME